MTESGPSPPRQVFSPFSQVSHRLDPATVQSRLGLGVVAPVEHPMLPDPAEPDRNVDQRVGIAAAGFQQQHTYGRISGKPVGEHAARRSGADDDVVVTSSFSHRYAQRAIESGGS